MIVRIVKMYLEEKSVSDFLQMFEEKKSDIRSQEGCLYLELLQDKHSPNIISTYSHWQSEDFLNSYRHSDFFAKTWKQTKSYFSKRAEATSYLLLEKMD